MKRWCPLPFHPSQCLVVRFNWKAHCAWSEMASRRFYARRSGLEECGIIRVAPMSGRETFGKKSGILNACLVSHCWLFVTLLMLVAHAIDMTWCWGGKNMKVKRKSKGSNKLSSLQPSMTTEMLKAIFKVAPGVIGRFMELAGTKFFPSLGSHPGKITLQFSGIVCDGVWHALPRRLRKTRQWSQALVILFIFLSILPGLNIHWKVNLSNRSDLQGFLVSDPSGRRAGWGVEAAGARSRLWRGGVLDPPAQHLRRPGGGREGRGCGLGWQLRSRSRVWRRRRPDRRLHRRGELCSGDDGRNQGVSRLKLMLFSPLQCIFK